MNEYKITCEYLQKQTRDRNYVESVEFRKANSIIDAANRYCNEHEWYWRAYERYDPKEKNKVVVFTDKYGGTSHNMKVTVELFKEDV